MKKLFIPLYLLFATLSTHADSLHAKDITYVHCTSTPFKEYWTGNADKLFLNIDLVEGMHFSKTYSYQPEKNGWLIQVNCEPNNDYCFYNKEYGLLNKLEISVYIENSPDTQEPSYVLTTHFIYTQENDDSSITTSETSSSNEMIVNSIPLNLNAIPEFAFTNYEYTSGIFIFENLYPYSQKN